ncbi:antibiotic biosynthesis monooxygenase family protein [Noviherbaspirillum sp. Root189]|uniref:antibiotic biosynthesis monooxygenase family protein n=1 Tax=Noviherbaspirillum sp. Root189 TaxID=1736487 RepID=UPI0009E8D864|nr:antibiotic biosynthesis monooxygenase [Noviherbaspirillum sp. Root189]
MYAVVFEVLPSASGYQRYLDTAAALRPRLDEIPGFVSIERFRSMTNPGWILSLSFWETETALVQWRNHGEHHAAQEAGRASVFDDYRLRVVRMADAGTSPVENSPLLVMHEHPANPSLPRGKRFDSLVTPGKHIDLWESDAGFAEPLLPPAASERIWCANVLRDYGLFDRQQAPQHFPAVTRG